jgi:hypothetical protein
MDGREARAAKNEALLREVNDRIEQVGAHLTVMPADDRLDFRCECGQPDCDSFVSLTVREYAHVRSDNDRFAVVPGHENPEIERVVERHARYVVVEKVGEARAQIDRDHPQQRHRR